MKKIKTTIIGIIALIGVIVVMPSCDIIYEILTTPSSQVDDNNNNDNTNSKTSKGKKQANSNDSNDPNSTRSGGN